eukprot:1148986-Pelagomonas_calceolata.AAC.2
METESGEAGTGQQQQQQQQQQREVLVSSSGVDGEVKCWRMCEDGGLQVRMGLGMWSVHEEEWRCRSVELFYLGLCLFTPGIHLVNVTTHTHTHACMKDATPPQRFNPLASYSAPKKATMLPSSKHPAMGLASSPNGLVVAVVRNLCTADVSARSALWLS